jgi:hypothetical protein
LGYYRKAAIRALNTPPSLAVPGLITGRPRLYESKTLLPILRVIWEAADYLARVVWSR